MEGEASKPPPTIRLRGAKSANTPLLPEVDAYLHLLVLLYLIDAGKKDEAVECSDQVWPLKQFFLFAFWKQDNLPGGQINDPSSGRLVPLVCFVPPSNFIVVVSDPGRAF